MRHPGSGSYLADGPHFARFQDGVSLAEFGGLASGDGCRNDGEDGVGGFCRCGPGFAEGSKLSLSWSEAHAGRRTMRPTVANEQPA